jgi:hypothetical protein
VVKRLETRLNFRAGLGIVGSYASWRLARGFSLRDCHAFLDHVGSRLTFGAKSAAVSCEYDIDAIRVYEGRWFLKEFRKILVFAVDATKMDSER